MNNLYGASFYVVKDHGPIIAKHGFYCANSKEEVKQRIFDLYRYCYWIESITEHKVEYRRDNE